MTMRPALPSDLPSITDIYMHAVIAGSHALANFEYPYRAQYPQEFLDDMKNTPLSKLLDPDPTTFNWVIADENDKAIAWAFWRKNAGEHHKARVAATVKESKNLVVSSSTQTAENLEDPTTIAQSKKKICPAASLPRTRLQGQCVQKDTAKYFSEDHWYLSQLHTSSTHQRKGYGTMLVLWGMRRAKEEGLPCFLTASEEGIYLYRKLGWRQIGRRTFPALEDMTDEERRKEAADFPDLEEQFSVETPSIWKWGGEEGDYDVFGRYEKLMPSVLP